MYTLIQFFSQEEILLNTLLIIKSILLLLNNIYIFSSNNVNLKFLIFNVLIPSPICMLYSLLKKEKSNIFVKYI